MQNYTFLLFLLLLTTTGKTQNAYQQWLAIEDNEIHLKGNCKERKIYASRTGHKADLELIQVQQYEKQRLVYDKMYRVFPNELLYELAIIYDGNEAIGLNLMDSSQVSYAFTEDQKLRYYVVDGNAAVHAVYSYDEQGKLVRCKDCLGSSGDHRLCVWYYYYYNKNEQLSHTATYFYPKGTDGSDKVLQGTDSLFYEGEKLVKKLQYDSTGQLLNQIDYQYNKRKLCEQETLTWHLLEKQNLRQTVTYSYYCNKKIKEEMGTYYKNGQLEFKQMIVYNKKGKKTKQTAYNAAGQAVSLYEVYYK